MKIRKGFVSNSSSSSFVCEVCGNVESGFDCSASDLGFVECSNGHIMCEGHTDDYTFEDYKQNMIQTVKRKNAGRKENNKKWNTGYEIINLNKLKKMESQDEIKEALEDLGYECIDYHPACACPICNYSIITSDELMEYVFKTYKNKDAVRDEIRDKFKTRDEFVKFLRGKSK